MLAVSTTKSLTIVDAGTLKRSPSSIPYSEALQHTPTGVAWSSDNLACFLSFADSISKYSVTGNFLKTLFKSEPSTGRISHLIAKDKNTLIFSAASKLHVFECASQRISQTFDSNKSDITSISLSNDSSLLASTSARTVHIHNLSLVSHTVLRGLPSGDGSVRACTFHQHARTRLLVSLGKQLLVYDTTRPSAPLKVIPIGEGVSGDIVAITCSPFSKTLIAVAMTDGHVGLVDLDKERGLFKLLNTKVPLTGTNFSPEGAALYLSTENGKLLIIDLRALDKPPKVIVVSEIGDRVEGICVQKKVKSVSPDSATSIKTKTTAPPTKASGPEQTEVNGYAAATLVPTRRTVAPTLTKAGTRTQSTAPVANSKASSNTMAAAPTINANVVATKAATNLRNRAAADQTRPSRLRSDTASSGSTTNGNTQSVLPAPATASSRRTKPDPIAKTSERTATAESRAPEPVHVDINDQPKEERVLTPSRDPLGNSVQASDISVHLEDLVALGGPSKLKPTDPATNENTLKDATRRPISRSSHLSAKSAGNRLVVTRTGADPADIPLPLSRASSTLSASRASAIRLESISARGGSRNAAAESASARIGRTGRRTAVVSSRMSSSSRTPSPDLPALEDLGPVTPVRGARRLDVLGLGTPEVDEWVEAGNAKGRARDEGRRRDGKRVGFAKRGNSGENEKQGKSDVANEDQEVKNLSLQVSPRRAPPLGPTTWATVPSPLRAATSSSGATTSAAHDLLRTILRDVLADAQAETRAAVTGLHLDLVRLGRGWRHEVRGALDGLVSEVQTLREENRLLREDNERLRRGW